jgi:RimJ/RimL family protein N-acetyltransferase
MPEIPLPDPPLNDGVVVLRRLDWADAPAIVAACNDPEIPRWTELPSPYTDRDAHEYLVRLEPDRRAGRALGFGIASSGDDALLASCGLTRFDWTERKTEIGYWVAREARGQSIATRATRLLSRWALETLGVERVELLAQPENAASQRVAEKAGFTREGLLRRYRRRGHDRIDFVMFSLLREDLERPPSGPQST